MGLTRLEFMTRVGAIREVEALTDAAYKFLERREFMQGRGAPHGHDWFVSFHASQFPGTKENTCGRRALYTMMDIPSDYPFSRRSRQIMDAGKDIEDQLVKRWYLAGQLLSNPPWAEFQTGYEDSEVWLTGSVDSILLPFRSIKPFIVEVKTKYSDDIKAMRNFERGPDDAHVFQLKTQIGLAHEADPYIVKRCFNTDRLAIGDDEKVCPEHLGVECLHEVELERINDGFIYYVSRDNPTDTWEYYFEYDKKFMDAGRARLADWKQSFIDDELPATKFEGKHPFDGWFWSKPEFPCKYCEFKKICKADHDVSKQLGHKIKLSDSAAIEYAKTIRPDYSYEKIREAVFKRWGLKPSKEARSK